APLESNIQDILNLSGVLFLANEQHSECKMAVLGEQVLKNLLKHQTQALLSNVPHDAPNFTNDDLKKMVNVVSAIDEEDMSPKSAKLNLLTLATSMDRFKSNVVEGIADLLVKLPFDLIANKNQFGEVDIQIRYYDPLLSSIVADTTEKVVLQWANKEDTLTPGIRPDAIVSTLVQRAFGQSLDFGKDKLGSDNTTNHSLCLDTIKLAILSRNSVLKYDHPISLFNLMETFVESQITNLYNMDKKTERPVVFFDVSIGDVAVGRMKMELFSDIVPRTAENFRQLCTGEYKMVQGGDFLKGDGTGSISIYGDKFEDENFEEKHTGPGLLSMANSGKNTNGCQFFITCDACDFLDGKHVVFGRLVDGLLTLRKIENVSVGPNNRPKLPVKITECGQM
ncbi:hypothetical protein, partial, partial [Parasitella parasitica]